MSEGCRRVGVCGYTTHMFKVLSSATATHTYTHTHCERTTESSVQLVETGQILYELAHRSPDVPSGALRFGPRRPCPHPPNRTLHIGHVRRISYKMHTRHPTFGAHTPCRACEEVPFENHISLVVAGVGRAVFVAAPKHVPTHSTRVCVCADTLTGPHGPHVCRTLSYCQKRPARPAQP